MALYLGSEKKKVYLDFKRRNINLLSNNIITNGDKLISSNDFILKDSNNIYLTAKEVE